MDAILGGRRMRRNRRTDWSRRLVRETALSVDDLIWPMFLVEARASGRRSRRCPGWSGCRSIRRSTRRSARPSSAFRRWRSFPIPSPGTRDETGSEALNPGQSRLPGLPGDQGGGAGDRHHHRRRARSLHQPRPDGVMAGDEIVNDETVEQLVRQALIQAEAGADIIAPSDMMDGRVGAIRGALDAKGFSRYPDHGLRRQIRLGLLRPVPRCDRHGEDAERRQAHLPDGPGNSDEALREVELDIAEGADMIMVKPGMPYLDIVWRVKEAFGMPTFAYQVSGEYAMIQAAAGTAGSTANGR